MSLALDFIQEISTLTESCDKAVLFTSALLEAAENDDLGAALGPTLLLWGSNSNSACGSGIDSGLARVGHLFRFSETQYSDSDEPISAHKAARIWYGEVVIGYAPFVARGSTLREITENHWSDVRLRLVAVKQKLGQMFEGSADELRALIRRESELAKRSLSPSTTARPGEKQPAEPAMEAPIPAPTIDSIDAKILDELEARAGVAATIQDITTCTPKTASKHLRKLLKIGYVETVQRKWIITQAGSNRIQSTPAID